MVKELQLVVDPATAYEEQLLKREVAKQLNVTPNDIRTIRIEKRSIDARQRNVRVNLKLQAFIGEMPASDNFRYQFKNVSNKPPVVIVGMGPAGLFAALKLIELGFKPIMLERGKDVSARKRDIAFISREHIINPDSNYCFGEGGAGTFSDGKLYTRSNKRGDTQRILQLLHFNGAHENILYESHAHIGSDKLPEIIKNIRTTILDCGGEVHFNTRLTNIIVEDNQVKSVELNNGTKLNASALVLATGHSARDIYDILYKQGIELEAKTFAMGVRVEHPQELIDSIQYHIKNRGKYLPAASYNLVSQVDERGVYSFCMCPGGYIVPSATSPDEVVVNGMSASRRHTQFANSGIVVEIRPDDLLPYKEYGLMAGLHFQKYLEQLAKQNGGQGQQAPAQRLTDFVNNRTSSSLPDSSYTPGLASSALHQWLPQSIGNRLQKGFVAFDKKMHGFLTSEAYIAGVESRTSSPLRIPRDPETMQHIRIKGLFPCGEGAGYAGGITSSAMDGENAAIKIHAYLQK
ncbi:MAG TPA: NAD(P)/FAD-dependent oxidoreductase [Bacteroidales bacterium]|nr:NAD(P)/FAD-dependent oxidoreductase [Bacteroidales bacterium]